MAFTTLKLGTVLAICGLAYAPSADADEPPSSAAASPNSPSSVPAFPDMPTTETPSSHAIDRTWLYLDDARVAAPLTVTGMTSVAYTSAGTNPDPTSAPYRGFAANTAQPGALAALGAEVGVLPRVSFEALGQMQLGGEGARVSPGALAGLRFALLPPSWTNFHLVASVGYLRETSSTAKADAGGDSAQNSAGDNGAWASLALAVDIQRLRLGLTTLGEHVFAPRRDSVDVMVQAGASYRVVPWFRVGVEWVGQDLEETFGDAAEGGARHFVGPTAALQLLGDRLTIVGGPSMGLSSRSPGVMGRLALAYGF
jgi:hypothetical protein